MKIQELRIDNIINHNGVYHKVIAIRGKFEYSKHFENSTDHNELVATAKINNDDKGPIVVWHGDIEKINPVPITDEILMKSGFEKTQDVGSYDFYWKGKHIDLTLEYELSTPTREYDSIGVGAPRKYIHEIQNIIFDLTCEEWEINL